MEGITLLIAVVALVLSILAYQRTGGAAELKRHFESKTPSGDLQKQMEALTAIVDSLREKTAVALERLEKSLRKTEKGD
jgi:hypothetical protein